MTSSLLPLLSPSRLTAYPLWTTVQYPASLIPSTLTPDQLATLEQVIGANRQAQAFNADRAEAHVNLGGLEARLGRPEAAEAHQISVIKALAPQHPEWRTEQPYQAALDDGMEALDEALAKGRTVVSMKDD